MRENENENEDEDDNWAFAKSSLWNILNMANMLMKFLFGNKKLQIIF